MNINCAINKKTKEYIHPINANKCDTFECIDCGDDLIFCYGDKIRPYFRHKKDSTCPYFKVDYGNNESEEHLRVKELLGDYLMNNKDAKVYRFCVCCQQLKLMDYVRNDNSKVIMEHIFQFNGLKRADIAIVNENSIEYIFEIHHTHRTDPSSRPEPWFEINTEDFNEGIQDNEIICSRYHLCQECIDTGYKCSRCGEMAPDWINELNVYKNVCESCDMIIDSRIYLLVPYSKKDLAKGYRCRWDPLYKKWYIECNNKCKDIVLKLFTKVNINKK